MVQILLALAAGLLTIAAPCILLPLPIIFGGSVGQKSKTRPLFITLGFILSFTVVALLANFLIQAFGLNPNTLRTGAVILLICFAVFMIYPAPFERLMARLGGLINLASRTGNSAGPGNLGGFILGITIGIIWAPCAGPILGSILALVALQKNIIQASLLLLAYACGAGLPMLVIAYGGQALTTKIKRIAKYSYRLQQIFGVILIILSGLVYFQYDTVLESKLLANFPSLGLSLEKSLAGSFSSPASHGTTIQAPEFTGINHWLNSEPLTMKSLRGKVVLVDFWTYSCINCVRTLPYTTKWFDKYRDQGLVVVGVHAPEFAFEKDMDNVKAAIAQYKINYPVAQDNDLQTWRAYSNQFWPAEYLIDQQGNVVYTHFGEGEYDATENAIRQLLGLKPDIGPDNGPDLSGIRSPEMYFGTEREQYLSAAQVPSPVPIDYSFPLNLGANQFALAGNWQFAADRASLIKGAGKIKLRFFSAKLFMVAQSQDQPLVLQIFIDGQREPDVTISESKLYTLFDSTDYAEHTVEINIPSSGFDAFTFTFG